MNDDFVIDKEFVLNTLKKNNDSRQYHESLTTITITRHSLSF